MAVGLGVDERKGTRVLVGVLVWVGFGVFVGGSWLIRELKIIGKYISSCALISSDWWLKPYLDGKDTYKKNKSNNEIRYFFLKIIPLSAAYPKQYYIDSKNNAIIIIIQDVFVQKK